MKLYALTDFPDDAINGFTPKQMEEFNRIFSEYGVSRMYFQYYGNRDFGWCMNCDLPGREANKKTSELMPNYSRVFVEAAKKYGMEVSAVMRPQEQGLWFVTSPHINRGRTPGIPHIGGEMLGYAAFTKEHSELRIKRRGWDIDPDAVDKTVGMLKLYKQNDLPMRFGKDEITIYVSDDNADYQPYEGNFSVIETTEAAEETVYLSKTNPYATEILTPAGAPIRVMTITGLSIDQRYIAVGVRCSSSDIPENRFINVPLHAIACFDVDGNKICATPGGTRIGTLTREPFLTAGFNFDDGFGAYMVTTLDPDEDEGYYAIAKGKNEYVHGALCECEPAVREYWLSLLEQALEDGYDWFGNRIECHSVHVDEPFAYGYNDCIKEEYFRRYGECREEEMELSKIAKIRGDAYTELFVEAARRVRARGRKVYLTLNVEMLHDPIPLDRLYAYPMNVEWQWERWLELIQPDEINFRLYMASLDFLLEDPQCQHMIEVAKNYGVPMTVERYPSEQFAKEFERLRDTGLFDAMIMYETASYLKTDGTTAMKLTELGKTVLPQLKTLLQEGSAE